MINVGDIWITREGDKVLVTDSKPGVAYPIGCSNGSRYTEEGEFWKGDVHARDLVEVLVISVDQ